MKKNTRTSYSQKNQKSGNFLSRNSFFLIVLVLALGFGYRYRHSLSHYFGFKSHSGKESQDKRTSDARNFEVLQAHEGKAIGIDVSEFQGRIEWDKVDKMEVKYPLRYVFIRATAGDDRIDREFLRNWKGAKNNKIIRGAYHYYRPNENSLEQAKFFIKAVQLQKGDLPPVLDIEKLPRNQSIDSLKVGLKRWLVAVEKHYGVKPIIYSSEKYYDDFLKDEFDDYLFWIANYNFYREKIKDDWLFWQFTEKATIPGIDTNVDVNIYNGDLEQLRYITVE
jgi:lysozyme